MTFLESGHRLAESPDLGFVDSAPGLDTGEHVGRNSPHRGSEQPSALHAERLVLGLVCARPHLQTLPAAGRPACSGGRFRLRLLLAHLLSGFSVRGAWVSLPPVSTGVSLDAL